MPHKLRFLLISLAAIVAVNVGTWLLIRERPSLRCVPSRCDFGTVSSGVQKTVVLEFVNSSANAVQLLGAEPTCNRHGCIDVLEYPARLESGSRGKVVVEFKAATPGETQTEIALFTTNLREGYIRIPIHAIVVPSAG